MEKPCFPQLGIALPTSQLVRKATEGLASPTYSHPMLEYKDNELYIHYPCTLARVSQCQWTIIPTWIDQDITMADSEAREN